MRKILITGAGSYIGTSVERWLNQSQFASMYQTDTLDMQEESWRNYDFSGYDTVFHVAGIAHVDIGKITKEQKKLYYSINCDLAVETANKAKAEDVKQFIYMSSIIVYGEGTSVKKKRVITRETKPSPSNFYGDSKWMAEQKLAPLGDDKFHVAILRPPMIYGEGCKGNYQTLKKIALRAPMFPDFPNERSMLYIVNLCEFLRLLIESGEQGIYFPQNAEYVRTSKMVNKIAEIHGRKIYMTKKLNSFLWLLSGGRGKCAKMLNKAFGNLVYDQELSDNKEQIGEYQIRSFEQALWATEK